MGRKLTQEEVIKRFKEVHGDKYDYSKVNYINATTKVIIICPEHGEFLQTPTMHKAKQGCPKCSSTFKYTTKSFFETLYHKYPGYLKYDFSKFVYKNMFAKGIVICQTHGEFLRTPNDLLHMHNKCPKCFKDFQKKGLNKKSIHEHIEDFKKVHSNKYEYLIEDALKIICPKHGEFIQEINSHKNGHGCPKCSNDLIKAPRKLMLDHIKDFKKVHLDKYSYDIDFNNNLKAKDKIKIICPEHGEFIQEINSHKNGHGCPKCSESKGERRVREFLESNNIKYSQEVKFFENYRFDFYLEDLNTVIEYDGKQHFEPVKHFGGLEGFLKTQERDKIKTEYCLENNIRIIRIGYFEEVGEILEGIINSRSLGF
jgi:very-short-patch-repair endonuclease